MTILVNKDTKILVQGITGKEGTTHTLSMLSYGTKVLAGVSPGRGGKRVNKIPVYDSVREALEYHPSLSTSIVFVPAAFAADAVYESIDAGLKIIVLITEMIPIHESLKFINYAKAKKVMIIGPNSPGIISPGECKVGIMPGHIFTNGNIGIMSRSGTLTYEVAWELSKNNLGQSTALGIGGDPVIGTDFIEIFELFNRDPMTKALVLIGEIGGDTEERFADYISKNRLSKPIVALIAGRTAPAEKRMGHAGAIITMGAGNAKGKCDALLKAGVRIANLPSEIPKLIPPELNAH